MEPKRKFVVAGAAMLALTATASAGPMSVPSAKIVAPSQPQTEPVYYRYYGGYYNGWNPGLAIAGTAAGLLALGAVGAAGGYYGSPYYGYNGYYGGPYGYAATPYYGGYRNYGYYGHRYRHYGAYGGGVRTGRSVGHMNHGWHHR